MVDIGGYGRDDNASIFSELAMGQAFDLVLFQLPQSELVNQNPLPYVLIEEEIFPLQTWLIKPFPGRQLTLQKKNLQLQTL